MITANTGFHFLTLTDNGADVTSQVTNNSYILLNITSDHTITATFVLPGDLDGSGQVDIADAILALQVTTRRPLAITLHLENDVNDDGKIGMAEVIYILQRISGTRAQ